MKSIVNRGYGVMWNAAASKLRVGVVDGVQGD